MEIRNTHQKQIIEEIIKLGLEPKDFKRILGLDNTLKWGYKDSGLYFIFNRSKTSLDQYSWSFSEFNPQRSRYNSTKSSNFEGTLKAFREWIENTLKDYINEISIGDPWEQIMELANSIPNGNDKEPYTKKEQQLLSETLNDLPGKILNQFENPNKQIIDSIEALRNDFNIAKKKIEEKESKSIVRKFIIGAFLEAIVAMAISQEKRNIVYKFVSEFFQNIQLPILPPNLP